MRQSQHGKKPRGRGRKPHNPLSRVYDSNGPDVKIRGSASHIADKYLNLARDAHSSGDRIAAENYYQHAEHYLRIIAAAQAQANATAQANEQQQQQQQGDDADDQPGTQAPEQRAGGDQQQQQGQQGEGRGRRGRRRNGARGDQPDQQADQRETAEASEANGDAGRTGAVVNGPAVSSAGNGMSDESEPARTSDDGAGETADASDTGDTDERTDTLNA